MRIVAAEPLYFGSATRSLFGWLHPARAPARRMGLVLCNPLGHEAISAHRTYRHLAGMCAAAGIPALRFDYQGTGDSSGSEDDPDRLAEWHRSIEAAILALRTHGQVESVCLFGLRLGALLALRAAGDPLVCGVIAACPVVEGRRYLRELLALAGSGGDAPDLQRAAGFPVSTQTREALASLNLAGGSLTAAPTQVLLLNRSDLPADQALAGHLRTLGAQVTQRPFPGFAELMLDAHDSVVPHDALTDCVDWLIGLEAQCAGTRAASTAEPLPLARPPPVEAMERAVTLDAQTGLFGILTPAAPVRPRTAHVLLLLNAGAVHHIGPNRLYVRLARAAAEAGITAIRFDLPGLGDTPARAGVPENVVYPDDALTDLAVAIRYARETLGAGEITCAGICSGAYHGLKAAAAGLAVTRVVVINPLTFFWDEGQSLAQPSYRQVAEATRYRASSRSLQSWMKLLRGEVNLRRVAGVLSKRLAQRLNGVRREIARWLGLRLDKDLAAELRGIAQRDIRMHFVFSGLDPGFALLHEQAGSAVGRLQRGGKLRLTRIEGADHTFTQANAQRELEATLLNLLAGS
jgi:alpha-beta hydrolase superfamily lysophospholipase